MANGLITVPNSEGNNVWAVPGTQMFFMGAYPSEPGFTVTDVSQDATNTYILTTWKGGWPSAGWGYQGVNLGLHAHPAPKFTCTGCTGAAGTYLSQLPAGASLYSYGKRVLTGADSGVEKDMPVWGHLVSYKIKCDKPSRAKSARRVWLAHI